LFAGCLEEESSKAAQSLREAGITRESIVKAIKDESVSREKALMEEGAAVAASAPVYSKRTLNIQFLARQRARMRGSSAIEIEDLLVALLIEDQGDFLDALSEFPGVGIDANYLPGPHLPFLPRALANDLLARVEALCSRSEPLPRGTVLPMSETVKRIFAVADLLRGALLQPEIEPLHLLGAALTDGSNSAVQVVREAGITSERIVKALSRSSTNN
jgi:DNA-binding phage protein